MTNLPKLFDIITGTMKLDDFYDKIKNVQAPEEEVFGYVTGTCEIGNDEKTGHRVTMWTIKFLNRKLHHFYGSNMETLLKNGKLQVIDANAFRNDKEPLYQKGDLIYNKKTNKCSIIMKVCDSNNDNNNDNNDDYVRKGKEHSKHWYMIASPGQKNELLSETFIIYATKHNILEVHKKRSVEECLSLAKDLSNED